MLHPSRIEIHCNVCFTTQTSHPGKSTMREVGLDFAKNVFQLHGTDSKGKIVWKESHKNRWTKKSMPIIDLLWLSSVPINLVTYMQRYHLM